MVIQGNEIQFNQQYIISYDVKWRTISTYIIFFLLHGFPNTYQAFQAVFGC